jgi:hypothetical protein
MFRRYLYIIFGLIGSGLVFSLFGCVTLATDLRKEGFNIIQKGFAALDETPNLHAVIKLKDVTVHIVGSRKLFDWNVAAAYGSPVVGYANTKNEIWVFGKVVGGKIIVNQAILGHEFDHLLNFNNSMVANPDQLDALGG